MSSNKEQAKKGFKTFILTLIISLAIFSGIYYFINAEGEDEHYDGSSASEKNIDVLGSESSKKDSMGDKESVFADLAGTAGVKEEPTPVVLAGADSVDTTSTIDTTTITAPATVTTTPTTDTTATVAESTVPDTGVSGPTIGVVLTLVILGFAAYIMFLGPRNVALHNFEKDFLDEI